MESASNEELVARIGWSQPHLGHPPFRRRPPSGRDFPIALERDRRLNPFRILELRRPGGVAIGDAEEQPRPVQSSHRGALVTSPISKFVFDLIDAERDDRNAEPSQLIHEGQLADPGDLGRSTDRHALYLEELHGEEEA